MSDDQLRDACKEETNELLVELESALLELEKAPEDKGIVGRIFRAMHTIKGSSAMFGFDEIAAFTHEVETVYDLIRNDRIKVSRELIDLTLAARDQVRTMIESIGAEDPANKTQASRIIAGFKALLPGATPELLVKTGTDKDKDAGQEAALVTYRICFRPSAEVFKEGINPLDIIRDLRLLGDHKVVAHTTCIPDLYEFDPELCYTWWDIILTTNQGENAICDAFIFVNDHAKVKIEVIEDHGAVVSESGYKKLGEILIEKGDVTIADLKRVLGDQKRIGELLVEAGVVNPAQVEAALIEQQHIKEVREKREQSQAAASIRVPSNKLDILVNLVGELVTVQARLTQTASDSRDERFAAIAEEVERLTESLRDNTMGIRMLQIGSTFSKFKRLVRDLSKELGKEIDLTTEGAETELDKTVIEKLGDPLVHLIRNCIDHGIELPEERVTAGKARKGTILLSAIHSGASVLIRIRDDGQGLDQESIRAKAIEKGIIQADVVLSEKDLFGLVFATGFSTAKTVTNVSGRGVGLDVVKRSIESLRGEIEIWSRKGEGTEITLKLPLTLAIIDGFLVRIEQEFYVMPLHLVGECMEFGVKDKAKVQVGNVINVRDKAVPFLRLRDVFVLPGQPPAIEHMVIMEMNGDRVGFVADQIIGEHKTVIKNLGTYCKNIEGVSGATILGDGTVALILDMPKLMQLVEHDRQEKRWGAAIIT